MALIVCPECGGNVSNQAERCPHCGFSIKDYSANQSQSSSADSEEIVVKEETDDQVKNLQSDEKNNSENNDLQQTNISSESVAENVTEPQKKIKKKSIVKYVIPAIAIILIVVFVFLRGLFVGVISIEDEDYCIGLNGTTRISCSVYPGIANSGIRYSSSDENVATVNNNGEVMAVGEGTCTITATALNGKMASCDVKVASLIGEWKCESLIYGSDVYYATELNDSGQGLSFTISGSDCTIVFATKTFNGKWTYKPDMSSDGETTYCINVEPTNWYAMVYEDGNEMMLTPDPDLIVMTFKRVN